MEVSVSLSGSTQEPPPPQTPPRPAMHSRPIANTPSPLSTSKRTKMTNTSSTPSKVRRKVSVEDSLESAAGIQRLVEYFVVISSQPRWESKPVGAPSTPQPKRPETRRSVSAPSPTTTIRSEPESPSLPAVDTTPRKTPSSNRSKVAFWARQRKASHLTPNDSSEDPVQESREEVLPPPKPNGTWKRESQETTNVTEGNIHLPQHTDEDYTFQPKITARFPVRDHADSPLNPLVTQFCHPVDDVIVPTREYQMPRVHHFVLTNDKGRKIYGTCLTIYEEYVPSPDAPSRAHEYIHSDQGEREIEVTMDETRESTLYLPRCLCILSIWPYMHAFREYVSQLYRLATTTDVMEAPIERYILNLCLEIPAPPPGAFEVQINILDSVIRFWSPPAKLPIAYVALPYRILFQCLDIQNILHIWYCLTMEQKVLLVSSQYSILTVCAEILCSLLYPMKWSHLYVPLLPRFLCPMLDAPVPYLCGVTRDNWLYVQQFVSDETIVIDLDRNSVMFGPQTPELPALPGKKWKKLQKSLEETAGHLFWKTRGLGIEYRQNQHQRPESIRRAELRWNEKLQTFDQAFNLQFTPDSENLENDKTTETGQSQWDRVQEAFLRFFVAMLKDYRKYIHMADNNQNTIAEETQANEWLRWSKGSTFDRERFVASQKAEYYPFLSQFTLTQQFDDFITKRLYSPEMPDIIFFDQSIDAKLNRSRLKLKKVDTPFLRSAKAHKVLKTFHAIAPNATNIQLPKPYVYKTWPEGFNPLYFGVPRPIPPIITAEFDRQAALVAQLRSNYTEDIAAFSHLFELYGSDYDTSPEGMTFTVFFYAYSAIIGREWEAYQEKQRELEATAPVFDVQSGDVVVHEGDTKEEPPSETSAIELHVGAPHELLSDLSLGLCEQCADGSTSVSNAVVYVAVNPCPQQIDEFNAQAQHAYETVSKFTNESLQQLQNPRSASLLDDDEGFAEYEEARAVAAAQLDLAFDTLKTMELRGLSSDPDVFKSLMEACGRCGDTKRALALIETMKRDGLAADQEILSCFMAAFAHYSGQNEVMELADLSFGRQSSDAYSNFLKKKVQSCGHIADAQEGSAFESEGEGSGSDVASSIGTEVSARISTLNQPLGSGIMEWLSPNKERPTTKTKRKRRKRSSVTSNEPATDRLLKQVVLGKALLDFLYPDLKIDTETETCMSCSHLMNENDVINGWRPSGFEDFTTCCPKCQHRFVPHFSVSCSSPTFVGSQGHETPLYCEFLSPWVLRKELSHLINSDRGIDVILDPKWRSGTDIKATIWWNLIAMFQRYELPISFLLQGSFQNRLINPVPQD